MRVFVLFTDEHARQLEMTNAKLVFSLVDNIDTVRQALVINKSTIPVVAFQTNQGQSFPEGAVDLASLFEPTGK